MKSIGFIIFFTVILTGCSNEYELEDQICDCYRGYFTDQGVDFDEMVHSIENHYIEMGLLLSDDGESYYDNVKSLAKVSNLNSALRNVDGIEEELVLFSELRMNSGCYFVDSAGVVSSRLEQMQKLTLQALEQGDLNESLWEIHETVLNERDYDHVFYKADYFAIDYGMYVIELYDRSLLGLKEVSPNIESQTTDSRNELMIEADAEDVITVNGDEIDIDKLYDAVLNFYQVNRDGNDNDSNAPLYYKVDSLVCLENIAKIEDSQRKQKWEFRLEMLNDIEAGFYMEMDKKAVIRLKNHGGTSYGLYIEIQNIIKKVVNDLREAKCEELGWPNYFELDDSKEVDRDYIRKLRIFVPERVIESKIQR